MKKHYFILFLLFLVLAATTPVGSLQAASLGVAVAPINSGFVYPSQWDIEALDFTLTPSADDTLSALTVRNLGTAYPEYFSVKLYADDGDGIFQGWKKDTDLGYGTYLSAKTDWYWQNLNTAVPKAGKKFFVTVETSRNGNIVIDRRTINLAIPALQDDNSDGAFDYSPDGGVFMASKNNGPTDSASSGSVLTMWKTTLDTLAPKTIITYPANSQSITADSATITGASLDQGAGVPESAYLTIRDANNAAIVDSAPVTNLTSNYLTWSYVWNLSSVPSGTYTITAWAKDFGGNIESPGDKITVAISKQVITPPAIAPPTANCTSGDLIKGSTSAVYYCGSDGKRYVFPTADVYYSWYYNDFSAVKIISDTQLAAIPLGGNVTYKPGLKMVKIVSDPKVYAVDAHGILRWVTSESLAEALYGSNWAKKISDVDAAYFTSYKMGSDILMPGEFNPAGVNALATSINFDQVSIKQPCCGVLK